jgi:hypothetical protein
MDSSMTTAISAALSNWRELNKLLKTLTEEEVKHALDLECMSPVPRKQVVQRLHERWTTMRSLRERAELMTTIFGE